MEKAINIEIRDGHVLKLDLLPSGNVEIEIADERYRDNPKYIIPEDRRQLISDFIKPDAH